MKSQPWVCSFVLFLSLPAAAASGDWTCRPGIKTPVRFRNQNVECASYNGRDCLWGACSGLDGVTPWTAPRALEPLICGADHKRKYGTDGYSQADHWCRQACEALGCGLAGAPLRLAAPPFPTRSEDASARKQGADAGPYQAPPARLPGLWIAVDEAARVGAVTMHGCFPVYDAYSFDVADTRVVTVTLQESRWGAMPPPHMLMLSGGWRNGVLELEGREDGGLASIHEAQHWTLRWDAAREHLVGKRNGDSIRLARLIVSSPAPQKCGSAPP